MDANKQSLTQKFLQDFAITDEENAIRGGHKLFSDDSAGNMLIRYPYPDHGGPITVKLKRRKNVISVGRIRLMYPIEVNGKEAKYLPTHKNMGIHPYFGGVYAFFRNTEKIHTIVIVEGEKKAFVLCKNGVLTIGISGIHCFGHTIKNEEGRTTDIVMLEELKRIILKLKPKNLILLHDADATLNEGKPDRLLSFISSVTHFITACKHLNLPCKLHYAHIRPEYNEVAKGPDDLYLAYKNEASSITSELLRLKTGKYFQFYDLQKTGKKGIRNYFYAYLTKTKPDFTLKVNEYISEQALALIVYIATHKRIILKAGTGTGKTTFALKHLATAWPGRIIILQPLTSNVDAIANDPAYKGKIGVIKGGATDDDIQIALHSKIVVATYDSFFKINNYTDEDLIICDEVHKLIKYYGIKDKDKKEQYGRVFKKIASAKNVVLISATPPKLLKKHAFQWVEVKAAKRNLVQARVIKFTGKIAHRLPVVLNKIDYSKGKVVLLTNSKEKAKELIKQITVLPPEEIALVCSDTKQEPYGCYDQIVRTKYIPDSIKLLLVTSLIDCGVDIYNTDIQYAIVAENNNPIDEDDTIQFLARFRKMEVLRALIYKKDRKVNPIDIEDNYKNLREFAAKEVDHLNMGLKEVIIKSAYISKRNICNETNLFAFYNQASGFFEVKELAVLEHVYKQASLYKPMELFCRNLTAEPHIQITRVENIEIQTNPEQAEFEQKQKQARKEHRSTAIELLQVEEKAIFEALYHKTRDKALRRNIIESGYNVGYQLSEYAQGIYFTNQDLLEEPAALTIFSNFLRFKRKGLKAENICRILVEYEGVNLAYLEDEMAILYNLDAGPENLSPQDVKDIKRVAQARKQLVREKDKHKKLSADQITAIINNFRPEGIKLQKNKAMRLFGVLFTFKDTGRKKGRFYIIENTRSFAEFCTFKGFLELLEGGTQSTSINRKISHSVHPPDIDMSLPDWLLRKDEPCPF